MKKIFVLAVIFMLSIILVACSTINGDSNNNVEIIQRISFKNYTQKEVEKKKTLQRKLSINNSTINSEEFYFLGDKPVIWFEYSRNERFVFNEARIVDAKNKDIEIQITESSVSRRGYGISVYDKFYNSQEGMQYFQALITLPEIDNLDNEILEYILVSIVITVDGASKSEEVFNESNFIGEPEHVASIPIANLDKHWSIIQDQLNSYSEHFIASAEIKDKETVFFDIVYYVSYSQQILSNLNFIFNAKITNFSSLDDRVIVVGEKNKIINRSIGDTIFNMEVTISFYNNSRSFPIDVSFSDKRYYMYSPGEYNSLYSYYFQENDGVDKSFSGFNDLQISLEEDYNGEEILIYNTIEGYPIEKILIFQHYLTKYTGTVKLRLINFPSIDNIMYYLFQNDGVLDFEGRTEIYLNDNGEINAVYDNRERVQ